MAPLLAGCSVLYNPNNLPDDPALVEAGIVPADAEVILDTNPDDLALEAVEPSVLVEGQGVGGSYSTILVIHGRQLVNNLTTVTITPHDAAGPIVGITVDNSKLDVSANGRDLAVPVAFAIDATRGKTAARTRLDVTVTQMGTSGPVTATLATKEPGDSAVLELEYLDELTNASPEFAGLQLDPGDYRYSKVEITGGLRASTNTNPLRVTAISSFASTGVIAINAVGGTPGPGGNGGGNGGGASTLGPANPGGAGAGAGAGGSSGGGGGFGTIGGGAAGGPLVGDEALRDFANNRSSGGGGGLGSVGVGAQGGGVGGAGGGVIELSAGGDLAIGDLTAIGGDGGIVAATASGGGGGGGSGGTVLLRAGRNLTVTSVLARGGLAGGGGAVESHAGGAGRVRIDVPTTLAIDSIPASYRGPMLMADSNLIVRTANPTFVVTGAKNKSFDYFFTNADGAQAGSPQLIGPSGVQSLTLPASKPLARGINRFCLLVAGGDPASGLEAMNCYNVVYLFTP